MTLLRMVRLVLALFVSLPAFAADRVENPNTTVELLAESAAPRPGSTLTMGVRLTPKAGWHSYWKNPGDAGIENQFGWSLPAGATAAPARYPTPERFVLAGIMNYVYSRAATLLVDVSVPAGAAPGTPFPVRLKLDYLICDDQLCVPESATLERSLTVGEGAPDPAKAADFAAARQAMPQTLASEGRFERSGARIALELPVAAAENGEAYFFALTEGALNHSAAQQVERMGDRIRIRTEAGTNAGLQAIEGVLRIERAGAPPLGLALRLTPGPVAAAAAGSGDTTGAEGSGGAQTFLLALGGALLGGLLLNVMPCVFPILSLKALKLARYGHHEADARAESLAYTAGVVGVTTALGALILALREAGLAAGWAFQLQDPRVVLLLLILVTAIALNLAGLFEVRGPALSGQLAEAPGHRGAFFTGALAAVIATPCTGPFMGAALGAALLLPSAAALAVFAGLGLGLALPFLALGFSPWLRDRLPRPGAWMERLRRILSIPMFLTALALAWVLGRQAGVSAMTLGLAAALGVGLFLWWLGLRQRRGDGGIVPLALAGAAAVLAAVAVPTTPAVAPAGAAVQAGAGVLGAQPFSEAALAEARASGKPVFVYFTADWCVTCKANEAGALSAGSVREAFARAGVIALVGDWTNGDPAITRYLEAQGRSGVPLYLFFHPDGRMETLPQLLTPARLTGLV